MRKIAQSVPLILAMTLAGCATSRQIEPSCLSICGEPEPRPTPATLR